MDGFVRPFNEDGRTFISRAVDDILEASRAQVTVERVVLARSPGDHAVRGRRRPKTMVDTIAVPPTFSHFIMNLPASAIDFLAAFRGVYRGRERLFAPHTTTPLPMIHVYCFISVADESDESAQKDEVCRAISLHLQAEVTPATADTDIAYVRHVSRAKHMYRVSVRLPATTAFASA